MKLGMEDFDGQVVRIRCGSTFVVGTLNIVKPTALVDHVFLPDTESYIIMTDCQHQLVDVERVLISSIDSIGLYNG